MRAWLVFALGGMATYLSRASFILFVADRDLPPFVERALRYVAPAVFAAIVLPAALGDDGFGAVASPDARLLALGAGAVVMVVSRNVVATLVLGMVALWTLQAAGL